MELFYLEIEGATVVGKHHVSGAEVESHERPGQIEVDEQTFNAVHVGATRSGSEFVPGPNIPERPVLDDAEMLVRLTAYLAANCVGAGRQWASQGALSALLASLRSP